MINLIKADLFRLKKSKAYKNSVILMGLFIILAMYKTFSGRSISILMANSGGRLYGFLIGDIIGNENYLTLFRSSLGLISLITFLILFIVGDLVITRYENGEIKNTVAYGYVRYKIYLANMISILLGVVFITISSVIISMSILTIFFKPEIPISIMEFSTIIKVMSVAILILGSMVSVYVFLATTIRSKALIATIGIFSITAIPIILLAKNLIETIGFKVPIVMLMNICSEPATTNLLATFSLNSIILILVSNILGCIIFKNQEFK